MEDPDDYLLLTSVQSVPTLTSDQGSAGRTGLHPPSDARTSPGRYDVRVVWTLLAAVALMAGVTIVLGLRRRFTVVDVTGPSMEPTLHHGDRVLVRRSSPRRLRVGDVVVIEDCGSPVLPDARPTSKLGTLSLHTGRLPERLWIIKRLAAGPGDPVPVELAHVESATVVPADRFVLLGDNADHSVDSRSHGFYRGEHILGVMVRPMR